MNNIYAIEWVEQGFLKYYAYTSKFLDQKKEITPETYEILKSDFRIPDKNNGTRQGIYYMAQKIS